MNLDELGLHEGLLHALQARDWDTLYPFLEKTVHHVNGKKENVSAQVRMGSGREILYLVPLLQWLLTEGEGGRALVILPSDQDVASAKGHALSLAQSVSIPVHAIGHDPDEADATALLSMGAVDVLAARQDADTLDLAGYAFVVVDGLERFVEAPYNGPIRRIRSRLKPAWERRTVVFSDKLGVKEQTLALDLADAPTELYLEEETEKAKHLTQATWYVPAEAKIRLLLGVLDSGSHGAVAVFCNLRENAADVARRLSVNGKRAEFAEENLPKARKDSLLARAKSGELDVVALTDESSRGFPAASFPLVVNYDIPLEGEPYLERLRFLDTEAPEARVLNFACDRYVYGIPAVEQFMGFSLGAVQADESLFAKADKSAGMPQANGNRSQGRGGYRGGPQRQASDGPRQAPPGGGRDRYQKRPGGPGPRRDEADFHRDNRGRDREGDPRNQESIRAGIAELTGVNLGGSAARALAHSDPPPRERDGRGRGPRPEGSPRGGRKKKRGRTGPPGASAAGPNAPRPKGQTSSPAFADPYAIPMEERMRLYKEKYGKHLSENPQPKAPGRKKGRRRRGRPSGDPSAAAGSGREGGGGPASDARPHPSRPPSASVPSKPAGSEGSRPGLIGRLFGAARKDAQD